MQDKPDWLFKGSCLQRKRIMLMLNISTVEPQLMRLSVVRATFLTGFREEFYS